jgi:hypothetical protein
MFSRLQRYNTTSPLSRFFGNFFLAGLQYDAEKPLTNRGGIVNFREGISEDLPGWVHGRGVVLPVISLRFVLAVLDLPLPPPKRRGFRGARYSRWIVLARVARFFRGNRLFGTEPDPAQAHFFPCAIPPPPRKVPATAQFPSFRRGARRAGWSTPRSKAASPRNPLILTHLRFFSTEINNRT